MRNYLGNAQKYKKVEEKYTAAEKSVESEIPASPLHLVTSPNPTLFI